MQTQTKLTSNNRPSSIVAPESVEMQISPPKFATYEFVIIGTAPYVQAKFSEKAKSKMKGIMESGSQGKSKRKRDPRDFDGEFEAAIHRDKSGNAGIPAGAFRAAMISACRIVDFKMTLAKLSVFVEADGWDKDDGTPLIFIKGEPERVEHTVRNATGTCDIRTRAMWREWSAKLRIRVDEDRFSSNDITNLLARVGAQVGIGEGRPDSKASVGMGWGTFRIDG